ncbi:lipid II flippase MurJ [Litoreibacter albidus]|uniref:Peptidoglycan biosynthesis protein MviN/MurJ, putative lipid II flippase n=1 Tax=Litoreibacter albidus TaxID=670155 RepID=A0A1H3DLU2_9RHOB|nr:lipid II flippase MurJ [Litoreibacter albidus]SDX67310.1 Peptidoglycan biosynthesis protein MviN/MurJ, putative lipid II flippase [Litoreibacter albidus]
MNKYTSTSAHSSERFLNIMVVRLLIPALVATGLFAGFAREVVLAYLFGTTREIEIFRVAFGLPSVLSDSLAVSFVAILIRLLLTGERGHPAHALRCAIWATLAFSGIVFLLGVFTMPWQARLLAPGMSPDEHAQLVVAGQVCWLTFLFVVLSLPMRALMSTRGRVWPGAASQVMRSGGFVLALLAFVLVFGWRDLMAPAYAAALGGATVLGVHILALGARDRRRVTVSLAAPERLDALSPTLSAIGLVLLSQLFLSAGRLLDRAVASGMGEGMLAGLEYSYALVMAVAAILATSTNLTLAPRMGRAIRDTGRLARGHVVQIAAIAVGATAIGAVLALGAEPITRLVFERGAFDSAATALTAEIFRLHALSLGPLVLALLLTQILLLHGRQRAVFGAAIFKAFFKIVCLWWILRIDGDIYDVAKTLLWVEFAMAAALSAAVFFRR